VYLFTSTCTQCDPYVLGLVFLNNNTRVIYQPTLKYHQPTSIHTPSSVLLASTVYKL